MYSRVSQVMLVSVIVSAIVAGAVTTAATAGEIIVYVDDDAPPGGDGLSWKSAFTYLRDAIDFASDWHNDVAVIRIAQGTYKPDESEEFPDGTGDQEESFHSYGVPELRGGYAGFGFENPDARDIDAYPTILSGDLNDDDQDGFVNRDDNSRVLLFVDSLRINGCTITSARTGIAGGHHPIVTNCRLLNHSGTALTGENVDVLRCEFDGNGSGISVGWDGAEVSDSVFTNHVRRAIHVGKASIRARRCTFMSNAGALVISGGGARMIDCDFIGNSADVGGALYFAQGVPISTGGRFLRCRFVDNSARQGGAVYSKGEHHGHHTNRFRPDFINCVFFGNSASESGGVMHSVWSDPKFINCTLVRNSGPNAGGIHSASSSTLRVFNSIIKGNHGSSFSGPGSRDVRFSNIGLGSDTSIHEGLGNINADARFFDHSNGDLRLRRTSPCIDAGRNAYVPNSVNVDLVGNKRFIDLPAAPNTGDGGGETRIVDMGAIERQR